MNENKSKVMKCTREVGSRRMNKEVELFRNLVYKITVDG